MWVTTPNRVITSADGVTGGGGLWVRSEVEEIGSCCGIGVINEVMLRKSLRSTALNYHFTENKVNDWIL